MMKFVPCIAPVRLPFRVRLNPLLTMTEPMKPCERRQFLYVRTPDQYMGYQLFLVPAFFQL